MNGVFQNNAYFWIIYNSEQCIRLNSVYFLTTYTSEQYIHLKDVLYQVGWRQLMHFGTIPLNDINVYDLSLHDQRLAFDSMKPCNHEQYIFKWNRIYNPIGFAIKDAIIAIKLAAIDHEWINLISHNSQKSCSRCFRMTFILLNLPYLVTRRSCFTNEK